MSVQSIPFLAPIDLLGNELQNVKLKEGLDLPSSPGLIFLEGGVPSYVNLQNVELPIHENSLLSIDAQGPAAILQAGRAVTITLKQATGSEPGYLSAGHYTLLAGATQNNTPNALVLRGASGEVSLSTITASKLTGLSMAGLANSDAVPYGTVRSEIDQAIGLAVRGLAYKEPARLLLIGSVNLSGLRTEQGYAIKTGDRILVSEHSNALLNGIWVAQAGTWTRAQDADEGSEVRGGLIVIVTGGDAAFADRPYILTTDTDTPLVIGADPLHFAPLPKAGDYEAGNGLLLDGLVFRVGSGAGIAVSADAVAIDSAYKFPGMDWNGNPIAVAYGGTGATNANQALVNLGGLSDLEFPLVVGGLSLYRGKTNGVVSLSRLGATMANTISLVDDPASNIIRFEVNPGALNLNTIGVAPLSISRGGTGAIDAATARQNLAVPGKFKALVGDGTATEFVVAHNLSDSEPVVEFYYQGKSTTGVSWEVVNANSIRVYASLGNTAIENNSLKVVVYGVRE